MIQFLKMGKLLKLIPWAAFLVFIVLLFRDPFGQRTLIPNLEPYPDTIHYIAPARSFASGGSLMIVREGRTIKPSVPPLYSLYLTPFFLVNNDPRMIYPANVTLAIVSFYLLMLVIKKLTKSVWITGLVLFLFATNYYMYWFPQWAMAENLILPIFLLGTYLLIVPAKKLNFWLACAIPFLVFGTKYAYLPFALVYAALYFIKLLLEAKRGKVGKVVEYILANTVLISLVVGYQGYVHGSNQFARYFNLLMGILGLSRTSVEGQVDKVVGATGYFAATFFYKNLPLYIRGLLGEPARFMWEYSPILPKYLAILSWGGLFIGVIRKRQRFLTLSLLALLLIPLIAISSFNTQDMRYIYHAIPTLSIGFCLLLIWLNDFLSKRKHAAWFLIPIFLFGAFYSFKNFQRLRYQVGLNLKYAETPWYYISVLRLNDYFTSDKVVDGKKPVVISPMPPYYIDFYSNGNYKLLPLDKDQEFRQYKMEAWGPEDYSDFHKIYEKYIKEGYKVYVSTYGLGNEAYLHKSFDDLYKDFNLTEVQDGCYSQCKIYSLNLKNSKGISLHEKVN